MQDMEVSYSRPDWNEVAKSVEHITDPVQLDQFWTEQCNDWLLDLKEQLGSDYQIINSNNFQVVTSQSDRYNTLLINSLERTLKRILQALPGIASDQGFGPHVALVIENQEQYYDYIAAYHPDEGEFGLSSGIFIDEGYGHFVFPVQEITYAEPIAVHELTHALLAHLPIPLWLNEGLAVSMEEFLADQIPPMLDHKQMALHASYWNEDRIAAFWKGDSFSYSDDGQDLSYELAYILVKKLTGNMKQFAEFVNIANGEDGGFAAANKVWGISLNSLLFSS